MIFMLMLVLSSFVASYHINIHLSGSLVISFSIIVLLASIYALRKGYEPARYFLLAWITLLAGVTAYALKGFGLLPSNILTDHSLQIGSAIEMSLLSLGLGKRMNKMNMDKEHARFREEEARRMLQDAKLKSSRLELELIKKNIEPHFILNTLNASAFWFEENPNNASLILSKLAEELRSLISVTGKELITLEEEISVCRSYLQIMNLRNDTKIKLTTNIEDLSKKIPPLIFHTIVENGITHGFHDSVEGTFLLKMTESDDKIVYTLSNDGSYVTKKENQSLKEGLGGNYIRTRLEEAYPGKWIYESKAIEGGWQHTIVISKF